VKEIAVVMAHVRMASVNVSGCGLVISVTLHVVKRTAISEVCVSQKSASVKATSTVMLASTDDVLTIALVMVIVTRGHVHVHKVGKE
jgi:hypothetical protein